MAALGCGRLDVAKRQLATAMGVFAAEDETAPVCYRSTIVTVEILSKLGDIGAAADALSDMERRRHPSSLYLEADRLLAGAWVAAARGAVTSAIATARNAADYARTHSQLAREVMCLQTATQFGDKNTAARLKELTGLVEGPRVAGAAAFAVALAAGDGAALQAASTQFEAMDDVFAAADASAHAAIAYRVQGRRGAALTASGRAQRLAAECGGAVSPALREAAQPLPLTRREREIISFVAQGLSNRQIADRLSLSIRSVEGHLYRASTRSGANTRAELSALIREFDARGDTRP
jgi:DNA-binding CsgD family transcriptional regulator